MCILLSLLLSSSNDDKKSKSDNDSISSFLDEMNDWDFIEGKK